MKRAGAALVAAIAVAYVGIGCFVGGGYDPGRDVAEAWAIARGGARPLNGPLIASQVHFGPVWFYTLAVPLTLVPTWFAAAMTAMLLSALQFPLAYAVGRRIADERTGVLWAVMLVLPGWASFMNVGFANTSVVAVTLLATLYCALRARDSPSIGWWLGAGVAASLATHAHPSCAWLGVWLAIRAWRNPGQLSRHLRDGVAALGAVAVGFALPFAPALLGRAPMLATTQAVAEGNIAFQNLVRVPAILWSVMWRGAHAIMATLYAPGPAWPGNVATLAALIGIAGAARGVAGAIAGDRASAWGLMLTIAAAAFVALIRPVTPVYMAFTIVPGYALLAAAGWGLIMRRRADVGAIAMACVLAAALVVGVGVVRSMHDGGGRVDGAALADITVAATSPPPANDIWLPALSADPLGRALCAAPGPVYAGLAYVLDVFYAMPLRMQCPGEFRFFTDERAGAPPGRLGLAMRVYRELGAVPSLRVGGIGIDPVTRIVAAQPHRDLPDDQRYPPHPYDFAPTQHASFAFAAPGGEAIVVANPYVTWMPEWTDRVECDGKRLAPAAQDRVTRVYRCAGEAPHQWQVSVDAANPRRIEIVGFVPRQRGH